MSRASKRCLSCVGNRSGSVVGPFEQTVVREQGTAESSSGSDGSRTRKAPVSKGEKSAGSEAPCP
eukprot:1729650-Amphidinium_carterae.1